MYSIAFVTILLLVHNAQSVPRLDPLVDSKAGLIKGLKASDGDYSMFLGIPYATVDEDNPFGPSSPHPRFEETFEAYDDTAICPQIEEFNNTIVGTLDCLHLNIYVPSTASSRNQLPVLVWIYGGGFSIGFSGRYLYGPKYLVRHDVILVTLNYRLGPYGFMCLDTPEVPGNQGLKDQLLALRWINDNIEAFGGDVNKITIFGESAGGMSVDYLLYKQEKLFRNVIMESGNSLLPGLTSESGRTAPITLAKQLGFETDDFSEALSFLSKANTNLVIAAVEQTGVSFGTCVEKEFDGVEQFISIHPVNDKIPKAKGIPILIGFNSNEGLAWYGDSDPNYFETLNLFYDALKGNFNFEDDELIELEEILRHFYIGDEKFSVDVKSGLTDFQSDFTFNHPTERSIAKYIDNGADKVFYYVFSYDGGRNFVKRKNNITAEGAAHADEIGYLFDISLYHEQPEPEDQLTLDRMTTMWANFAKYGDPTPEITELLPIKWEPITKDSPYYYLDIDKELTLGKRPFKDRMAFWDLFYAMNWEKQTSYINDV